MYYSRTSCSFNLSKHPRIVSYTSALKFPLLTLIFHKNTGTYSSKKPWSPLKLELYATVSRQSRHGTRQWLECPQYTGTNHMPCMGEQIRSMQWPLGRPCQPHLQGFIATTILIQSNDYTPFCTPLKTRRCALFIRALDQATLHFMERCRVVFSFTKKEISTSQGSISLSSYYNSLVKHRIDKLKVISLKPTLIMLFLGHTFVQK